MCLARHGDAGVDMVLDAVEAANADSPSPSSVTTLIHAYFAHPDTAQRCATLGSAIDTQPLGTTRRRRTLSTLSAKSE